MIENDHENNINFYDNLGIRKAILLSKYVNLMKLWIKLVENIKHKNVFFEILWNENETTHRMMVVWMYDINYFLLSCIWNEQKKITFSETI